jgi:signal transduction histidine kinase
MNLSATLSALQQSVNTIIEALKPVLDGQTPAPEEELEYFKKAYDEASKTSDAIGSWLSSSYSDKSRPDLSGELERDEAFLHPEARADLSHELRCPVNAIIGCLKFVLDGLADTPEEKQEFLEMAYGSSLKLSKILASLIEMLQLKEQKLTVELEPVKLDQTLEEIESFFGSVFKQRDQKFSIQNTTNEDEIILWATFQLLKEAIFLLLNFVIESSERGEITLLCETVPAPETAAQADLGLARIILSDTEMGCL